MTSQQQCPILGIELLESDYPTMRAQKSLFSVEKEKDPFRLV